MNRPGTVVAGAASQVPEEVTMLTVTVQELDDDVILRCLGKIVRGEETAILCAAVRHRGRNVILDLGGVDAQYVANSEVVPNRAVQQNLAQRTSRAILQAIKRGRILAGIRVPHHEFDRPFRH